MAVRFLQGFFGSPCLASGGALLGDIYSIFNLLFAMMAWVAAVCGGPSLGPLLAGFLVTAKSWRWSLWETFWASILAFIMMFLLLPETSTPNILLRRAQRVRKLTGDSRLFSESELKQKSLSTSRIVTDAPIKPLEITIKDPAVLFVQVYTGIIYGIYYSFFESFSMVYPVMYGMSLGESTLVFLSILMSCIIGISIYFTVLVSQATKIKKEGLPVQERRLIPALFASFGPVAGLFIFGWTARESIHWIVPTVGVTIFNTAAFILMQSILIYVPFSYLMHAASLIAANDLFRSGTAFAAILFAPPTYKNMGIAKGTSLLGGLTVIGIIGIFILYLHGAKLRAKSRLALS
ncbi:hypothetical protein FOCG_16753 [Fusarium oxysporum f. sp. radicis-lycopersici 26381]|nr:hypothetical protein FOCG_16753 [Fusarium oxysporum f. sp. radicis-lycopersici 26381]